MEAKELRIGNLVYFDTNEIRVVDSRVIGFCANSEILNQIIPFQPIPLTEEILLKCGFMPLALNEQINENQICSSFNILHSISGVYIKILIIKGIYKSFTTIYINNSRIDCCDGIMPLHQLQNLYFALTAKELDINL